MTIRLPVWLIVAEVSALFSLMLVYIWEIHEFRVPFVLSILALGLASNAIRGEGYHALGLCWRTVPKCLRALLPGILGIMTILVVTGVFFNTVRHIQLKVAVTGFLMYCAWGLFQQYLLNGFLVNRLFEISGGHAGWHAMVAAGVFSAAHAPNWFLMAVTLPAGYFSALIYSRHRNLFVLGLVHALIGSLLYLVIPDWLSHGLYVGSHAPR
jgi:hypothetical protein